MGKKLDPNKIKVNPDKFSRRGGPDCNAEVISFMECMKNFNYDIDDNCARQRVAMLTCWERQAKTSKHRSTINYHFQRLARMMRK
ncbi:hypothetical protein BSKO_07396 [Bryopsis sp. KO-2023]|nr:hypothetical protein BSKO_07396 [Bryopsis sp. KO-2023]